MPSGKKTVYVGEENGLAAQLKLVVNLVLFVNMAGAAEGLTLGLKAGISPDIMLDTLCSGAAGSNVIEVRGKDMLADNYPPSGPIWIVLKDLDCAIASADDMDVPVPLAGLVRNFYMAQRVKGVKMRMGARSSVFLKSWRTSRKNKKSERKRGPFKKSWQAVDRMKSSYLFHDLVAWPSRSVVWGSAREVIT